MAIEPAPWSTKVELDEPTNGMPFLGCHLRARCGLGAPCRSFDFLVARITGFFFPVCPIHVRYGL